MADTNQGKGWTGDSEGHAQAGSQSSGNQGNTQQHVEAGIKGGQSQGQDSNPGNFANRPHEEVEDAAQKGGES